MTRTRRIFGSIVVLVSILVLPFWIYIPVLFIAIIVFPFFFEGILFALLIDVIYGSGIEAFPSLISPFALSALVLLIILLPIRESLRSHV